MTSAMLSASRQGGRRVFRWSSAVFTQHQPGEAAAAPYIPAYHTSPLQPSDSDAQTASIASPNDPSRGACSRAAHPIADAARPLPSNALLRFREAETPGGSHLSARPIGFSPYPTGSRHISITRAGAFQGETTPSSETSEAHAAAGTVEEEGGDVAEALGEEAAVEEASDEAVAVAVAAGVGEGEEVGQGVVGEGAGDGKQASKPGQVAGLWAYIRRVPERKARVVPAILEWQETTKKPVTKTMAITLIKRMRERGKLRHAIEVAEWILSHPEFPSGPIEQGLLFHLLARAGFLRIAEEKFAKLPTELKTEAVYNGILAHLARRGAVNKLKVAISFLEGQGVALGEKSMNALMQALSMRGLYDQAAAVLEEKIAEGVQATSVSYNILLSSLGKASRIKDMEALFEKMLANGIAPDVVTYNTLMWAYFTAEPDAEAGEQSAELFRADMADKAERTLQRIRNEFGSLSLSTYGALLWAYGKRGQVEKMEAVYKEMQDAGVRPSRLHQLARVQGYGVVGDIERAEQVVEEMAAKGELPIAETYNGLIGAYFFNNRLDKVSEALQKMQETNVKRTQVTYKYLFDGYYKAGDFSRIVSTISEATSHGALELKPKFGDVRALVLKYLEDGEATKAAILLEHARILYPKHTKLLNLTLTSQIMSGEKTEDGKAGPELAQAIRSTLEALNNEGGPIDDETQDILKSVGLEGLVGEIGLKFLASEKVA